MKVLHLGAGNLFGGIERFLIGLARVQQISPALENHYLLTHEGRLARELREAKVSPEVLPTPTRLSRPWTVLDARSAARRVQERLRPDIVISHGPWPHVVLSPGLGAPTFRVLFLHGPATSDWLHRLAGRYAPDHVLANSEFARRTAEAVFPATPTDVVRPILPPMQSSASRESVRASLKVHNEVVIIQVSRLEPLKGHGLLLDALELISGSPDWILWIVGGAQRHTEAEYLRTLRARASSRALGDRVRFLGERDDVDDLLGAADIFCQPNVRPEGFGLSIVEALWASLPVVTTRGGGPSEFLSESCSRLVDPRPDELADAIRGLVEDPAQRAKLGAAGRRLYDAEFQPLVSNQRLASVLGSTMRRWGGQAWG